MHEFCSNNDDLYESREEEQKKCLCVYDTTNRAVCGSHSVLHVHDFVCVRVDFSCWLLRVCVHTLCVNIHMSCLYFVVVAAVAVIIIFTHFLSPLSSVYIICIYRIATVTRAVHCNNRATYKPAMEQQHIY